MGTRYVEIKEARATDPANGSAMAQLVELMATSRDRALAAQAALARAQAKLATIPDGLAGPGRWRTRRDDRSASPGTARCSTRTWHSARDCRRCSAGTVLGATSVLTQDPAELRPTGGYLGSYGIVTFDRGRVTDRELSRHLRPRPAAGLPLHQAAGRAHDLPARFDEASPGSWPPPTGRPTFLRAPRTLFGCTPTSPATRRSTACSGSRPTRSTSC